MPGPQFGLSPTFKSLSVIEIIQSLNNQVKGCQNELTERGMHKHDGHYVLYITSYIYILYSVEDSYTLWGETRILQNKFFTKQNRFRDLW